MFKLLKAGDAPSGTHWFSASQIQLWRDCPVCWAYSYLDGIKQEGGEDAFFGTYVHTLLEKYLKTGAPIDPSITWGSKKRAAGRVALSGIEHLPTPKSCEGVEDKFLFEYQGVHFRGSIDFYYKKDEIWIVGDHKTKGNLEQALTPISLPRNLQANLYAFYVANKHNVDNVLLNWVYYKSKGPSQSKSVTAPLDLTMAMENVNLMVEDCRKMLKAFEENKLAIDFDVPPNGCKAYGPCASKVVGTKLMRNPSMSSEKKSLADFLNSKVEEVTGIEKESEKKEVITDMEFDEGIELDLPEPPEPNEKLKDLMKERTSIGWTLLVDCLPRKGDKKVIEISDLLRPVFKQIAKQYNVSHPSFIPYESTGVYVTMLDKQLTENPPEDGSVVVLNLSSPDARNALDVLISHASFIYQGTRG